MRYNFHMGINARLLNYIAAALCAVVWISPPLAAQTTGEQDRVDGLFEQLLQADADAVARIQSQILSEWSKSGSAAMDLLLRRAEESMEDGDADVAVGHFTALIDHAPDFAEGYNGRAAAYYQLGLIGPAIDDLRQALVLEPRHFGAMTGVAVLLEELGRTDDALEVWRKIEQLSPADGDVAQAIDRLLTQQSGASL